MYNDRIFSAGSEGKIRVWDLNDGTCVKVLNDNKNTDTPNPNPNPNTRKNPSTPPDEDEDISYYVPIYDLMILNNTFLLSIGGKIELINYQSGAS